MRWFGVARGRMIAVRLMVFQPDASSSIHEKSLGTQTGGVNRSEGLHQL